MEFITGVIVEIFQTKILKSGYKSKSFVVDIGSPQSPNPIKIECTKNIIDQVDTFNVNDTVGVMYVLQGRKWESKYYVNINANSIDMISKALVEEVKEVSVEDIFGEPTQEEDTCPF